MNVVAEQVQNETYANGVELEKINPHLLRPHPYNEQIYGEEPIDDLREKIKGSHWIKALVVTPNNTIISGHRRWRVAIDLGMDVSIERRYFASELDEITALLLENVFRQKTTSQKGREGKTWKYVIAERKKQTQEAQGEQGKKGGRPSKIDAIRASDAKPLAAGAAKGFAKPKRKRASRTSDEVAALVDLGSGDTLERVEAVNETVDQLIEQGKPELAQALVTIVDQPKGVSPAAKVAGMEPERQEAVLDMLANGEATTVKGAELALDRAEIEAQAQAAPTKPRITLASWETWLPQQPMCDLLITDPPYSTDVEDIDAFAQAWISLALSKVKPTGRAYVCIGAYPQELRAYLAVKACMSVQQILVWSYKNTIGPSPTHDYKLNWQAILYFRGADAPELNCKVKTEQFSAQEINAPDGRLVEGRYHAWQKPDKLAEQLIRHSTKEGDIVLDCFTGTGTFLLAAHHLGREAYGCDCSKEMLEIAEQRGCEVSR